MRKRVVEILILASFLVIFAITNRNTKEEVRTTNQAANIESTDELMLYHSDFREVQSEEQEEIRNEIMYGELEELALMVQAEAGNQDELGMRYVADVGLNRVDSSAFPDNLHEVLYQIDPVQFSTTRDGGIEKAGYTVSQEVFQIVLEEYENRTNSEIVYFRTDEYHECGKPAFKHGAHYFSTL